MPIYLMRTFYCPGVDVETRTPQARAAACCSNEMTTNDDVMKRSMYGVEPDPFILF